jgi:SAM-dependent methyltransferase
METEAALKVRDSGMPDEEMWDPFFSPEKTLLLLGPDANVSEIAEFGCGYGTFTLPAARIACGKVHAFDIEPEMIAHVREKCRREGVINARLELRDFVAEDTGLAGGWMDGYGAAVQHSAPQGPFGPSG